MIHPALILALLALLLAFARGWVRTVLVVAVPLLGLANLAWLQPGWTVALPWGMVDLVRPDRLAMLFGVIFHLALMLGLVFSLRCAQSVEFVAAAVYGAAAVGAVFAGDLFSFYVFWEVLAVSATFLILARGTNRSFHAGMRYLVFHVLGGLILLGGILVRVAATGSLEFGALGLDSPGGALIFLGFGINCAWPLVHTWLTDSYPEASIGGVLFLSAFTTKVAVYALARGFAGEGTLVWIGTAMAMFPIFFAVIENDLRRVLAYSLVNQVGFMVVGIGIGTELAVNGAVAHAFNDILFKALLFMTMGAVLYRTGKIRATDLGGLYRSMPWTCAFCIVGAASISAFPLFSGFVSKSMVVTAAAEGHLVAVWFALMFASAGVFHHAGIKIPFFAFFGHDSGLRPKEAPPSMLAAMGLAAVGCVVLGTFPHLTVYRLLPFPVAYEPYTAEHVVGQAQLLFFSALAFTMLLLGGLYPAEMRSTNLDFDWVYRRLAGAFAAFLRRGPARLQDAWDGAVGQMGADLARWTADLPVRIGQLAARMVWVLESVSFAEQDLRAREVGRGIAQGAFPIGLTGLGVVALVAALLALALWMG